MSGRPDCGMETVSVAPALCEMSTTSLKPTPKSGECSGSNAPASPALIERLSTTFAGAAWLLGSCPSGMRGVVAPACLQGLCLYVGGGRCSGAVGAMDP